MRGRVLPILSLAARLSQGSSSCWPSLDTFGSSTLPCIRPPSSHATRRALLLPGGAHLSRDADALGWSHFSRRCITDTREDILAALRSPPDDCLAEETQHSSEETHLSSDKDPLAGPHFSWRCSTDTTEEIVAAALRSPPDDCLPEEIQDSSEETHLSRDANPAPRYHRSDMMEDILAALRSPLDDCLAEETDDSSEEAAKRMLVEGEEDSISATKGGAFADELADWWIHEGDDEEAEAELAEACKAQSGEDADYTQAAEFSTKPDDQEGIDEAVDALEFHWREGNQEMLLTLEEVNEVLQNVRAKDVQVVPVHDRCEWTDLMVFATGKSDRHVRGIADALVYKVKKKGNVDCTLLPTIEGQEGGRWLVVDCGV